MLDPTFSFNKLACINTETSKAGLSIQSVIDTSKVWPERRFLSEHVQTIVLLSPVFAYLRPFVLAYLSVIDM